MERVETLLKKLQDQFAQKAEAGELLLTVQMLQAELMHLQGSNNGGFGEISVTLLQNIPVVKEVVKEKEEVKPAPPVEEEKIIEVLQVDEAEIEAELEEIKRNAETLQKISTHNKPHIVFEPEDDIPTLAHQNNYKKEEKKEKEVN